MPEIALDPDINGVCRVGGILLITSNPTNDARTKTTSPAIIPSAIVLNP
jgi:hypothetical protein